MKIHSPIVTGSLSVSPSLTVTGSILGTASFASTASVAILANSSSYPFAVTGSTIYTTALGSLTNVDKDSSVFIGYNAGAGTGGNAPRATAIGYEAASGSVADDSVSVGYRAAIKSFIPDGTIVIGRESGYSSSFFQGNVALGPYSGYGAIAAYGIFLGYGAGDSMQPSPSNFYSNYYSTFIGYYVGRNSISTGFYTTLIGPYAGEYSKYLESNLSIGYGAGSYAISSSRANFIGTDAGANTYSASYSNFIGYATAYQASSSYSTLIGTGVGRTISGTGIGDNNIIIGKNITLENGRKDSINLGAIIFATGSYSIDSSNYTAQSAFSGSANGRVGINQPIPQYTLDVSGSGNYTNGLTVTGSTTLSTITGSNMLLTGTLVAQTINVQQVTSSIVYSSGSNRFGNQLTDVQQMTGSLRVTGSGDHYIVGGNVGIGATPGAYKLDVSGTGRFSNGINVNSTGVDMVNIDVIDNSARQGIRLNNGINASGGIVLFNSSSSTGTETGGLLRVHQQSTLLSQPSAVFRQDGNADILQLQGSSGNIKMLITSGGNVGIGTTTPQSLLDLGATTGQKLYTYYFDPANKAGFGIDVGGNNYEHSVMFAYGTSDQGRLTIGSISGSTFRTKMTISGSGNVGIGTTTPGAKLEIFGPNFRVTNGGISNQVVVGSTTAAASGAAKNIIFVDHTHVLSVKLYVSQDFSNVGMYTQTATTAYGSNNMGTATTAYLGNVTNISLAYNNTGYYLQVTVTYTGTAPTIYWVVEGMSYGTIAAV